MEQKKQYGALSAMCGQAGTARVVVALHEIGSEWVKSTHYKDMDEFWDRILSEKLDIDWCQVKGQDKVYVNVCKVCNQYYPAADGCPCTKQSGGEKRS